MSRIVSTTTVRRPRAEVFDFLTTPANWKRWHPSTIEVTGDASHPLTVGERCTEEFVVAGRHGVTEWTVVTCEPPSLWAIDSTAPNGAHATITYALTDTPGGTTFIRTLEYRMASPLMAVLDALAIRRKVERESETALANVKRVLEDAGAPIPA